MKHIIFVGMEKASKRNLHLLERDMPMNESYHILSFRSLREFTDKLPFLQHLLNGKLQKGEENWNTRSRSHFKMWTFCLYKERAVFHHMSKSCLWNVYCLKFSVRSSSKKMISPVIFDPEHSFKWYNALCLTKNLFIKVSMAHWSRLVIFYCEEKFCFARVGKSLVRCLLSKAFRWPCRKSYISSYIWHKSFIQTVKCFFFK